MSTELKVVGVRPAPTVAVAAADTVVRTPGGTLVCTTAGAGEPLLLVHGLGATRHTWRNVVGPLAAGHAVIAPDLPGHGDSGPPEGDYSLGAMATALRDVLVALGHRRATVVGHSLGGGVAMQFAYQFPDRLDRLILVSSGGLGAEVSPLLCAATLPGASSVVGALGRVPEGMMRRLLSVLSTGSGLLERDDAEPVAAVLRGLSRAEQRDAFLRTARTVIDWRGQTVGATRKLGLLAEVPALLAWGSNDRIIPPDHHRALARLVPTTHTVEIAGAGHFPQETAAGRLVPALHRFLADTPAFSYDEQHWRELATETVS